MFFSLLLNECKQIPKHLTYYMIVIFIVLFCTSQLGGYEIIQKPELGQKDYGYTESEEKSVIMRETMKRLAMEYARNNYGTYRIAFYNEVTLNKTEKAEVGKILAEITGKDKKKLDRYLKKYYSIIIPNSGNDIDDSSLDNANTVIDIESLNSKLSLTIAPSITYEHFIELMAKVDRVLGGGSNYAKKSLQSNAYIPMTYEQALEEYNNIVYKDRLSGAYARIFCDFISITLAILPVFIAVTVGLRDRRGKANEIIYSRSTSSIQIILSRYLAMVLMLLLPVIVLALIQDLLCILAGIKVDITIDYLAFPKYILIWLLPTIMITISLGTFLTVLTDSAIAIFIQGVWWYISISSGNLGGNCGWNLIPRHNSLGYADLFQENIRQFIWNRSVYTIVAVILIISTIFIYDMKRKGRLKLRGKIFSNSYNKSEAKSASPSTSRLSISVNSSYTNENGKSRCS